MSSTFTINEYNLAMDSIHEYNSIEGFERVCKPKYGRTQINEVLGRLYNVAAIILNPITAENLAGVVIDLNIDKTTQQEDLLQISNEIDEIQKIGRRCIDDPRYGNDNDEDPQGNKALVKTRCDLLKNLSEQMIKKVQVLEQQIRKESNAFADVLTTNTELLPKDLFRIVSGYAVT